MQNSRIARSAGIGLASLLTSVSAAQYSSNSDHSYFSTYGRNYSENTSLVLPQTASLGERLTLTGAICGGILLMGYGVYRCIQKIDSRTVKKVSRRFTSSFRS